MNNTTYIKHDKENLSNTLWQYITKEHMEIMTGHKITEKDWQNFINDMSDSFCDSVSRKALKYFEEWLNLK